jgi:ribose 5-phosphate isomerase B
MKLAIGADERTYLTDDVVQEVQNRGHDAVLFGHLQGDKIFWPEVARQVAESVAQGQANEGILFCWTGTRLWNRANVLCISLRATSAAVAQEILDAWFDTAYQPNEEDDACLAQVTALEKKYGSQRN